MYSSPDNKPSAYQFMGYELNEKRQPTFLWSYHDVLVEDFPSPTADGFDRHFTIKEAGKHVGQLFMRFQTSDQLAITVEGNPSTSKDNEIRVPITFKNKQAKFTVKYFFKSLSYPFSK